MSEVEKREIPAGLDAGLRLLAMQAMRLKALVGLEEGVSTPCVR